LGIAFPRGFSFYRRAQCPGFFFYQFRQYISSDLPFLQNRFIQQPQFGFKAEPYF